MDNDTFERMIANEIIESIQDNPDDWESAIGGIRRKSDKLVLHFSYVGPEVKIYEPNHYEFKNERIHNKLAEVVKEMQDRILEEYRKQRDKESRDKLSEFFHLDNRKNKLEALREISEERYKIDIEEKTGEIKKKPWWKFW